MLLVSMVNGHKILSVVPRSQEDGSSRNRESYIQIHLERTTETELEELKAALLDILMDVRTVVTDWQPMLQRLNRAIAAYTDNPPPVPVAELAESIQFLKWLADNHFTFLGMRAQAFVGGPEEGRLDPRSWFAHPERPQDLVATWILPRGLRIEHALADERRDEGVVLGEGLDASAPQPVEPGVADVRDVGAELFAQQEADDGRAHAFARTVVLSFLVNLGVGQHDAGRHAINVTNEAVLDLVGPGHRLCVVGYLEVRNDRFDCEAAGHFARCVSTHTISNDS